MALNPDLAIDDLEQYLNSYGFYLSNDAKSLVLEIETFAFQNNRDLYEYIVLSIFFLRLKDLRSLMLRKGTDPDLAIRFFEREMQKRNDDDPYEVSNEPYSEKGHRGGFREQLVDYSMAVAKRNKRGEISEEDIFEGYLEAHDDTFPPIENGQWTMDR